MKKNEKKNNTKLKSKAAFLSSQKVVCYDKYMK